jgi:exodeoxyribonuclease VII large subunit|uniref:Exodeoxyribonuclease 7 large subunit n=1 Tax=Desulfobacca acetoxidans TaxID=60893 RepID=A0A7V6A1R1_9BACT
MEQELTNIYTVSSLTREIRGHLETHFPLVWVSGEVSNLRRPVSGHYYFTLKDATAQLRAVLFKGNHLHLRYKPEEGRQILCRGRITVYEQRGDYQLIVDYLEPVGLGVLAQAFEALKTRLAAEGLFDAAHKKRLPFLPRRIALLTSPTGAVVRDFLRLLNDRFPHIHVLVYPVKVQGAEAAGEIVQALREVPGYPGVEVIVLARGGGSLEDLWPFNEERVARTIYHCPLPVVSAIGHEVDYTIADFVADVRAPTPSAAVELVVPDRGEIQRRLERTATTLYRVWRRHLDAERRHLISVARRLPDLSRRLVDLRLRLDERAEALTRRFARYRSDQKQRLYLAQSRLLLLSPRRAIQERRQWLDQLSPRLVLSWRRRQETRRQHLCYCESHLEKLDPMSILKRGYAVATRLPDGAIIREANTVPAGANIRVRVYQGAMDCEVIGATE